MKTSAFVLMAFLVAGCGNAEPRVPATDEHASLSISADLMLTSLAVASPKPLSGEELCDNAGICGEDQAAAARELSNLGLVTLPAEGSYQLTEAGHRFVVKHYEVIREGNRTTVTTRDGAAD